MKKYLTLFILLIASMLLLAGCSAEPNTSNSKNEDADLTEAGEWEELGELKDGRSYSITLALEDNGDFEIVYANEGTPEGSDDQTDASIKGTYKAEDEQIVFTVTDFSDENGMLNADVKKDAEISLPFEMSDTLEMLTLDDVNKLLNDVNDQIVFNRA